MSEDWLMAWKQAWKQAKEQYDGDLAAAIAAERQRCAKIAEFAKLKFEDGSVVYIETVNATRNLIAVAIRGGGPIIDNVGEPGTLCGHELYCRQATTRAIGWRHCRPECPMLKIPEARP